MCSVSAACFQFQLLYLISISCLSVFKSALLFLEILLTLLLCKTKLNLFYILYLTVPVYIIFSGLIYCCLFSPGSHSRFLVDCELILLGTLSEGMLWGWVEDDFLQIGKALLAVRCLGITDPGLSIKFSPWGFSD